jgi:outer membrane protein
MTASRCRSRASRVAACAGFVLLAAAAAPALAQSKGAWIIKGGLSYADPQSSSDALTAPTTPGVELSLGGQIMFTGSVVYAFHRHWGAELLFGLPYRFDVDSGGSASGAGRLATTKVVIPALMLQYRFLPPASEIRPYLGFGVAHAQFGGEEGSAALTALTNPGGSPTRIEFGSATGPAFQFGLQVNPVGRWYVDAMLFTALLKSKATLSTGSTADVKVNPLVTSLSVGYRF